MKRLPYAVVVMLGLTGGAYAADFGDLSVMSASGLKAMMADAAALQIPEPQNIGKHHCSGRDLGNASSARKGAEAVLANPAAFTVKQMGDVLVNLDDVCICLPWSSGERQELDALRDAVNNAQRKKVRQNMGTKEPFGIMLDKTAVRKDAQAVLANPAAFTVKQMGDVLVNLDDVCSSLSVSSSERLELNALRDAVNNAQREKVRQQISHRN